MKSTILAVVVAFMAGPAMAQIPAPLPVVIPDHPGAVSDPTCGGRSGLAQRAVCVSTTQGAVEGLVDAYNAGFASQSWLAAGGGDNLIVYVKRREGGGCDAIQLLAFTDATGVGGAAEPAYVAIAAIPGDVCATPPAAPVAPAAPATPVPAQ